ncbi:S8 family serine peptidase [Pseudoxanthomonas sp. NC8]|nr:S8 family serine peptidase [Pseudoxanthomonas sp. NC8]
MLPEAVLARQDELNGILRALDDRDGGIDSPAAREIVARMKAQTPAEAEAFDDVTGRWSGYVHGTAIADIALRGLPDARIVVARQQWWHGRPPVPCWTRELADREAASIGDLLAFLVASGARVVNMSWGRAERAYLGNLQACAPQMPDGERRALARYSVERIRAVLQDGMRNAPQVLFVGAAGNAGASLQEENPATRFSLPNFIMVGAVDRHGAATDWTNTGAEISLFANGDRVPARLPGGSASFPSGTSMAAPLVANAAAKMLTVAPGLDGARLRQLLERTATPNATGQRLLHPRDAVEAARAEVVASGAGTARRPTPSIRSAQQAPIRGKP